MKSGRAANGTNRHARRAGERAAEQVSETYDALADLYTENYESGNPDRPFLDQFLAHVKKGARLMDLGCGTGSGAKYFFDHGMRVEGVDLSRRMIQVAKRRFPEIPFRSADLRDLEYPMGQLNAVWAGYSLFHMGRKEFEAAAAEIRRLLVPGGIFGLTMQEGEGEVDFPEPLLPGKRLPVCLYSLEQLTTILRANLFKVLSHKRRSPASQLEYPYDKLLLVARATGKPPH